MEWLFIIGFVAWLGYKVFKNDKRDDVETDFEEIKNNSYSKKDYDNFEGWFYDEVENYVDINLKLKLKYTDGNGNTTDRIIYAYKFGQTKYGGFILAKCEMRNANRTFRTDRIKECVDYETGEFISNIPDYIMTQYKKKKSISMIFNQNISLY